MLFARKQRSIRRLLIVEDEPLVAFDNEHYLADLGFEVAATVDCVADAVAVIEQAELDLVLADVQLSDGSGTEVAVAANAKGVPVLFVTGACPDDARKLAVGCLSKPYQHRDLKAAIDAIERALAGDPIKKLPAGLSLFVEISPAQASGKA